MSPEPKLLRQKNKKRLAGHDMKKNLRLLILEDMPVDLDRLLLLLNRENFCFEYQCVHTRNEFECLLMEQEWDLILSDYVMPQFSGIEALEVRNENYRHIPFIMVSGTIGETVAVECMKAGAQDYILKDNYIRLPHAIRREVERGEKVRQQLLLEEQLKTQQKLLQGIIDHSPALVSVKTLEGKFLLANKRFSLLAGSSNEQVVGQTVFDLFEQKTAEHILENINMAYKRQEPINVREQLLHVDGRYNAYLSTYFCLKDSKNELIGICTISTNVTDQVDLEETRLRLEKQLVTAQKMEAIALLTGGVAHDFNNILSSINGFSSLIYEAGDKGSPTRDYVAQIKVSVQRARDLVNELLTFSKGDNSKVTSISVSDIISQTLNMLASVMPSSIRLEHEIEDSCWVKANPVQIQQIIMNLAINARDAMSGVGVLNLTLKRYKTDEPRFCSSCYGSFVGDYICLQIIDTGSGIAHEHLGKIFNPFFTTKAAGKGTGMGLAIIHGLVHTLDGHVQVEQIIPMGTKFSVFLPSIQAEVDSIDKIRADTYVAESVKNKTVLLVDDESAIVKSTKIYLELHGLNVFACVNPTDALNLFRSNVNKVDILICDQTMPGITGIELVKACKRINPSVYSILLTGYSEFLSEEQALAQGADLYALKPIELPLLLQMIRYLVSSKKPQLETQN